MAVVVTTSDAAPTTTTACSPASRDTTTSETGGGGCTSKKTVDPTTTTDGKSGNGTSMPLQLLPGPCYAVKRGRLDVTGCIFVTWSHAYPFVHGLSDAIYRPFDDPRDAARWLLQKPEDDDGGKEVGEKEDGDGGEGAAGCGDNVDNGGDDRVLEDFVRKRLEAEAEGDAKNVAAADDTTDAAVAGNGAAASPAAAKAKPAPESEVEAEATVAIPAPKGDLGSATTTTPPTITIASPSAVRRTVAPTCGGVVMASFPDYYYPPGAAPRLVAGVKRKRGRPRKVRAGAGTSTAVGGTATEAVAVAASTTPAVAPATTVARQTYGMAPMHYYYPQPVAAATPYYYYYGATATSAAATAPAQAQVQHGATMMTTQAQAQAQAPSSHTQQAQSAMTAAADVLARCPPTPSAAEGSDDAPNPGGEDDGVGEGDSSSPEGGRKAKRKRRKVVVTSARWNRMYERLVRYRERHGTCDVPPPSSSSSGTTAAGGSGGVDGEDGKDVEADADPGEGHDTATAKTEGQNDRVDEELWRWVRTQRREYGKFIRGGRSEKTLMSDEKIDKLRSIGFDFGHHTIDERIDQVRKYRELMCDPNAVPSLDHPMLGTFVRRYRVDRSAWKRGRGETLRHFTEEELTRLDDSIGSLEDDSTSAAGGGFDGGSGSGDGDGGNDDGKVVLPTPTDGKGRIRRPTKAWENMFERLSRYRARHGTCEVPSGAGTTASLSDADRELCKWTRDQRSQYKRMIDGRSTQMYDEKVRRLRSIGFDMGHHTFEERLEQLRHYREGFAGDEDDDDENDTSSIVPPLDHPLLGRFVRRVLEDIRRMDEVGRGPRHHTVEQINILRSSPGGFDVSRVQPSSNALRLHEPDEDEEREWDGMMDEWLRHKESHAGGDGGVIPPVPQGTPLSRWVQVQRMEFRKLKRGTTGEGAATGGGGGDGDSRNRKSSWSSGPCRMTPRRLARLNDVGFDFGPRNGKYMPWNDRLDQLRAYVEENGHCRVPLSHPTLGEWVERMRKKYNAYVRGDDRPGITEDRIRQLSELGFVFRASKSPAKPILCLPWKERFEQLLEFKRVHGTTVVPQHYEEVPGLGRWVKQQRIDYQTMVKGGKSKMTPKKVLMLVEVGFVFDAKNRRGKRWASGDG